MSLSHKLSNIEISRGSRNNSFESLQELGKTFKSNANQTLQKIDESATPVTKFRSDSQISQTSQTSLNDSVLDLQEASNRQSSHDWILISEEQEYTPSADDVGFVIRVECFACSINRDDFGKDIVLVGPVSVHTDSVLNYPVQMIERVMVQPPIGVDDVDPEYFISTFRVVSYNILAEIYATKQMYPYCDAWMLSWPYRRSLLIQEISKIQADILCLQEVQSDNYEYHLAPAMLELGYEGVFCQKSRESMGQYGKVDGCAVFWGVKRFQLVDYFNVDFNDEARSEATTLGTLGGQLIFLSHTIKHSLRHTLISLNKY